MKKLLLLSLVALGASLSACTKDMLESGTKNSKGNFTISAVQSEETKTNVGSTVTWAAGDAIKVYSSIGDSAVLTLSDGAGTARANFTGTIQNVDAVSGRKFFGIYPSQNFAPLSVATSYYSVYKNFVSGKPDEFIVQFSVPEVQTQDVTDPSSLGKYTMMVTTPSQYDNAITAASDVPLTFNQICTILDFKLNNIPAGNTVQRVAVKSATPGDLAFNVRGAYKISTDLADPDFLKIKPLTNMIIAATGAYNRGASYSDLLYVKTNGVTEGSTVSIVTLPVDLSVSPKDLQIVVTVANTATGETKDLIFNKNAVANNFERGKRHLTTLDLSAPTSAEYLIYRDDFQWISADISRVNYFDCPGLTTELGYASWSQGDKDQGWASLDGTTNIYQRHAGYLKLGKTNYGGNVASPSLNVKNGMVSGYASVKVRVRLSAYSSVGGGLDEPNINVSATDGAIVLDAMPVTISSFAQLKTYEFTVLNFSPTTRIVFEAIQGTGKFTGTPGSNRYFIDDFEITSVNPHL